MEYRPANLVVEILLYADIMDYPRIIRTCKAFRRIVLHDSFQKRWVHGKLMADMRKHIRQERLGLAILHNNVQYAERCLRLGIGKRSDAVMMASQYGNLRTVKYFIDRVAIYDNYDCYGDICADIIISNILNREEIPIIDYCVKCGIISANDGLVYAAYYSSTAVVKYFVDAGADNLVKCREFAEMRDRTSNVEYLSKKIREMNL